MTEVVAPVRFHPHPPLRADLSPRERWKGSWDLTPNKDVNGGCDELLVPLSQK
jgi:hypothetical protein